jgi:hypothetical protein
MHADKTVCAAAIILVHSGSRVLEYVHAIEIGAE